MRYVMDNWSITQDANGDIIVKSTNGSGGCVLQKSDDSVRFSVMWLYFNDLLSQSEPVERDVYKKNSVGWTFNKNETNGCVYSRYSSGESDPLFSTRLLALKAWRHEVELDVLNKIFKIDKMIEVENGNS